MLGAKPPSQSLAPSPARAVFVSNNLSARFDFPRNAYGGNPDLNRAPLAPFGSVSSHGQEPIDLRKEAEAIYSAFERSLCRDVVFEVRASRAWCWVAIWQSIVVFGVCPIIECNIL